MEIEDKTVVGRFAGQRVIEASINATQMPSGISTSNGVSTHLKTLPNG
ncbi:MAG: hypothetical protein ACUVRM_08880 [Bacillota bacterium]